PDSKLAQKSFEDYMREGPLAALDVIERATGEREVNAIGYCVGGTLLVAALAYMASTRDQRIASATLFAAQVDFTHAGDLKVFVDEEQIAAREREMSERGYLEGKKMATAFNLLRSNDLIWPYVINNYLRGKEPAPFDLLYWTGPKPTSANLDRWLAKAKEHAGSWWPDWLEWIKARNSAEVPAREPGGGKLALLEDAPGSYVRVRD